MLKEKVTELIDRYESGDEWLSAIDVCEELEEILDEESYEDDLFQHLKGAIDGYIIAQHDAERGGGRIPDGSDEFIERIEEIIGYEN